MITKRQCHPCAICTTNGCQMTAIRQRWPATTPNVYQTTTRGRNHPTTKTRSTVSSYWIIITLEPLLYSRHKPYCYTLRAFLCLPNAIFYLTLLMTNVPHVRRTRTDNWRQLNRHRMRCEKMIYSQDFWTKRIHLLLAWYSILHSEKNIASCDFVFVQVSEKIIADVWYVMSIHVQ